MSATRFVPNPFPGGAGERLYRTGDLALSREYDQDYQLLRQKVGPWQSDYQHDANGNIQQHPHLDLRQLLAGHLEKLPLQPGHDLAGCHRLYVAHARSAPAARHAASPTTSTTIRSAKPTRASSPTARPSTVDALALRGEGEEGGSVHERFEVEAGALADQFEFEA